MTITTSARLAQVFTLLAVVLSLEMAAAAEADLLLRNGTLLDGTGAPGVQADVAIQAGRIMAIGKLDGVAARETIDARDRVVCPGFIDLHSHADGGILQFRAAENYIRQGVTTL